MQYKMSNSESDGHMRGSPFTVNNNLTIIPLYVEIPLSGTAGPMDGPKYDLLCGTYSR